MAHQKKEKTVMTRIKVSDRDFVKNLADEDGISISDKLSDIIHQWNLWQYLAKKNSIGKISS